MRQLHDQLETYLSRSTLVFPSEIAAEFWRRAAVTGGNRRAVREDRLISWDTFKETAFSFHSDAAPANRTARTVFAERFLAANESSPVLTELVRPEFAAEARGFARSIVSILPRIPAALVVLRNRREGRLGRIRRDLQVLETAYSEFMDSHGFFEPGWMQSGRRFLGGDYTLVMPELTEDFGDIAPAVTHLEVVRHAQVPDTRLQLYDDAWSDLRSVMHRIASLLDAGQDPEDIFLTVCDLDSLADRVRHVAEEFDVPVLLRTGRTLMDSPVGRFIRAIGAVDDSGFSVARVERLLLNAAVPLAAQTAASELVLAGVQAGALGGSGKRESRWSRVARAGGPVKELLATVERLVPVIAGAATFAELRSSFNQLLATTVDRTRWQPRDERVLERVQEELRSLAVFEQRTGLEIESPYRFWTNRLEELRYVPQADYSGVPVLPWRVAAATCPAHHFVVNANHSATSVLARSLPFLGDADRGSLADELTDRDLTADFMRCYLASGLEVRVSASRQTFDGPGLPSGYFVASGQVEDAGTAGIKSPRGPLAMRGEIEYSRGRREDIGSGDFTRERLVDLQTLDIALESLRSRSSPDLIRLSYSHIDLYRACPFQYLLVKCLAVSELEFRIDPENPATLGSLYHGILAAFFTELAELGEKFERVRLAAMRERLDRIADEFHNRRPGMIPDIVYAVRRELFERIADALLENDAHLIEGHSPLFAEAWRRENEAAEGYVLVGQVDRATRAPDGSLHLVDYKKGRVPRKVDLNAGSRDTLPEVEPEDLVAQAHRLGSVQIPLYVRLLELGGEHVSGAGYYSLEKGEFLCVFDERAGGCDRPAMSRERFNQIMEIVDQVVRETAENVQGGDFRCNPDCDGCGLRSICRTRYHVD
jgi:hypothetical protein